MNLLLYDAYSVHLLFMQMLSSLKKLVLELNFESVGSGNEIFCCEFLVERTNDLPFITLEIFESNMIFGSEPDKSQYNNPRGEVGMIIIV